MHAAAMAVALAGACSARAEPDRTAFLALLHDGRFEAAQQELGRRGPPTRPDDRFFEAFVTYWKLVFDDENPDFRATLDQRLGLAIAAAESSTPPDASAAVWGGSSHLLLAGLRAQQRRPLAAAYEAKKAKRLLESASKAGATTADALFGLGTYNYLADTVPTYVRGLRALLGLPKGNRDLGIEQLTAAASGSRVFALEARTLLLTIFANKHERLYGRAIEERDRLLREFPDTIASSYAAARLDLSLGRNGSAIDRLTRAEKRARGLGDVDPVVLRCIELLRARAELSSLRPDRAEATARGALATGEGLGPSIRQDLEAVLRTASRQADGITWPHAGAGLTPSQETAAFAALALAQPERPLLALLAGDGELRAGRPQEALDWFARAAGAKLPPELEAGSLFRQGQAEDLLGHRARALELYGRIVSTRGFAAKDAALYYQQTPYRHEP
jgi:tetratricopeptide (TPR) repeat protein